MSNTSTDPYVENDNFEISVRIFGTEILAMVLKSKSKARNFFVLSLLSLVLVVAMAAEFGPALKDLVMK